MISLASKRSGDDASNPSGLLPLRQNERERETETVSREIPTGMHAEAERELILSFSLFFFLFSYSSSTYAPVAEKMSLASERCAFVSARETHTGFSTSTSVFPRTLNAKCVCQILKRARFCTITRS